MSSIFFKGFKRFKRLAKEPAFIKVKIYISRDWRNGQPLNVEQDKYRFECPDIRVEAKVRRVDDDYDIEEVKIAEDVPAMKEVYEGGKRYTICTDGFLFKKGQSIELDDSEQMMMMTAYEQEIAERRAV